MKKEATFVKISTNDKKWKQKISSDPAMIEKWALKSGLSYLFQWKFPKKNAAVTTLVKYSNS